MGKESFAFILVYRYFYFKTLIQPFDLFCLPYWPDFLNKPIGSALSAESQKERGKGADENILVKTAKSDH